MEYLCIRNETWYTFSWHKVYLKKESPLSFSFRYTDFDKHVGSKKNVVSLKPAFRDSDNSPDHSS